MIFKLSWRNLWRNKRRSLITMASIFFAVVLAVVMRSLQLGTYDQMISNAVSFYTGYAQVQSADYPNEPILNNSFRASDSIYKQITSDENIKGVIPRLESAALVSGEKRTMPGLITGIIPEKENQLTDIKSKLVNGKFINAKSKSALIGKGLAEQLKLEIGDSIVILGSGFRGSNAAGIYTISGILKFGTPELNNSSVYLPLQEAQVLFGTGNRITSYVLMVEKSGKEVLSSTVNRIKGELGSGYSVMSWRDLSPELVQSIQADSASGIITLAVLYMVILFGVFGTLLMMMKERSYEFGVLTAIGMKKARLAGMIILETWLLALLGSLAGLLISIPVCIYLNQFPIRFEGAVAEAYADFGMEPVLPASLDPSIFISQTFIVFILTTLLAIYPFAKIMRLHPIKAMRNA